METAVNRSNGDNNDGIPTEMGIKAIVIPWGWG